MKINKIDLKDIIDYLFHINTSKFIISETSILNRGKPFLIHLYNFIQDNGNKQILYTPVTIETNKKSDDINSLIINIQNNTKEYNFKYNIIFTSRSIQSIKDKLLEIFYNKHKEDYLIFKHQQHKRFDIIPVDIVSYVDTFHTYSSLT